MVKKLATPCGMIAAYVIFFVGVLPGPRMAIPLAMFVLACAVHVLSRPPAYPQQWASRIDPKRSGGGFPCA